MARVNIYRPLAQAYATKWAEDRYVEPLSQAIWRDARAEAPIGVTGNMRERIHIERRRMSTDVTHRVGSGVSYAIYSERGTKPHPIYPRTAGGRLVFFWAKVGRRVRLRMVNHPGQRAQLWLTGPLLVQGVRHGFKVVLRF